MNITHDFHTHSVYSSDTASTATMDRYLERAQKLGITKLGFAEHFWDDTIEGALGLYQILTRERMMTAKKELEELKKGINMEVFFGCEVEYNPATKSPAITQETAEMFDYILVPHSHSHETMPKEFYDVPQKHCDFLVDAYNNIIDSPVSSRITAMAHPFALVRCPYHCDTLINMVSDDTFKKMFDRTAQKGIAIEINTACVFMDGSTVEEAAMGGQMRIFKLAKECGCKLIFGSDSHDSVDMNILEQANAISNILELKESDIAKIAL